jgi:Ion transport protein
MDANINENILLFIIGTLLWIKAFHQLSFLQITGSLYQVVVLLVRELITFGFYYMSVLVIYAIVGVVLFSDLMAFNDMASAMFTLFTASAKDYNINVMNGCHVGNIIGYIYFNSYLILNVILLMNLLIGQLAYAYRKSNKERNVLMLLYTLSVRDVSEADEKYSSVVSVPFPLSVLNLLFGSIVLGAKSPFLNLILLHFYFVPVMIVCLVIFILYQLIILPFCYIKMLGHKWALIVKAPVGKGSSSSLDRAG